MKIIFGGFTVFLHVTEITLFFAPGNGPNFRLSNRTKQKDRSLEKMLTINPVVYRPRRVNILFSNLLSLSPRN
jgi:hypothetical protein